MIKSSEPPVCTGDPWIDAYLKFRQACLDGATPDELTGFGTKRPWVRIPPPRHHFSSSEAGFRAKESGLLIV
jgi:hypothetical protein